VTYWLIIYTLFWSATYGTYPSKDACEEAAKSAPWYAGTTCMALPQH
jgi:hypothetical protein